MNHKVKIFLLKFLYFKSVICIFFALTCTQLGASELSIKRGVFREARIIEKIDSDKSQVHKESLIQRKATKLISSQNLDNRMKGIDLLKPYPNQQNITMVKKLLNDDWFYLYGEGVIKQRYPIRLLAYDLLTDWGIQVNAPIIEINLSSGSEISITT